MLITILLALSLFLLLYSLVAKELPDPEKTIKEKIVRSALSIISAGLFFLFSSLLFKTIFAGIPWGTLGWFLPGWIKSSIQAKKHNKIKAMARNFITTGAGMYSAGMVTPDVIRTMAAKMPEPLSSEFEEMIRKRNLSPNASFPRMFTELAKKYQIEEFQAVSAIIAASERVGGPRSASRGLKRLGRALRQQERLAAERAKATLEPKIAAILVITLLLAGLLLDATVLSSFFQGAGKLVMALSSALITGLIFMYKKIMTA